jgi:copper homeostasis protein
VKGPLLEVAVESLADAIAARDAGADRLELCADLAVGGLTPAFELYRAVRLAVGIPIAVMIRPVADESFVAGQHLQTMLRQIAELLAEPPAAFVFGALNPDGSLNGPICRELIGACAGVPAVFHRAWDVTPRTPDDLEDLVRLGFRRLLTSGCQPTAEGGIAEIRRFVEWAGGRIEILPGSGVSPENAAEILRSTGCDQLHGTFRIQSEGSRVRVDPERVRATRAVLDHFAGCS